MRPIKGVIFDADGTLLDSMAIWKDAGARYLMELGITAEPDLDSVVFPMTLAQSSAYMKEHYNLSQSVGEIMNGVHLTIRDFYYKEVPLKKGVKKLLEKLSAMHIPMVVATTSEREHIEAAFARLSAMDYFQRIFTCSERNTTKHQPDIYLSAAGYLGSSPDTIWVFEDVLYAIRTARNAGFFTVGVYDAVSASLQEPMEHIPDIYTRDFSNVIDTIELFERKESYAKSTYDRRK